MNTIDIKTLSDIEVKAMGYEQIVMLEGCQNNLKLISQEIKARNMPPVSPTSPVDDTLVPETTIDTQAEEVTE
jgi:hypothetical protein